MAWRITGQLIETCNCTMFCPCWFGVPALAIPDEGWCGTAQVFRVQQGHAGSVDLTGRTVVLAIDFPKDPFSGNGTARLYVDDGANTDQSRELEEIFTGKKSGSPEAILQALIATWLPTRAAKIAIREDDKIISVQVGDIGRVNSELLADQAGRVTSVHGAGLASALQMASIELAPSTGTRWADPDLRAFEAKSGARGNFTWAG